MAEFYNEGGTIVIIVGSVFAFLIMLSRIIYKSKCKKKLLNLKKKRKENYYLKSNKKN